MQDFNTIRETLEKKDIKEIHDLFKTIIGEKKPINLAEHEGFYPYHLLSQRKDITLKTLLRTVIGLMYKCFYDSSTSRPKKKYWNIKNKEGLTPIAIAARCGFTLLFEVLEEHLYINQKNLIFIAAETKINSNQCISQYDENTRYIKWQTMNFLLKNSRHLPTKEKIENSQFNLIPNFKNYLIKLRQIFDNPNIAIFFDDETTEEMFYILFKQGIALSNINVQQKDILSEIFNHPNFNTISQNKFKVMLNKIKIFITHFYSLSTNIVIDDLVSALIAAAYSSVLIDSNNTLPTKNTVYISRLIDFIIILPTDYIIHFFNGNNNRGEIFLEILAKNMSTTNKDFSKFLNFLLTQHKAFLLSVVTSLEQFQDIQVAQLPKLLGNNIVEIRDCFIFKSVDPIPGTLKFNNIVTPLNIAKKNEILENIIETLEKKDSQTIIDLLKEINNEQSPISLAQHEDFYPFHSLSQRNNITSLTMLREIIRLMNLCFNYFPLQISDKEKWNMQNNEGLTPIAIAARCGFVLLLEVLLENQLYTDQKDLIFIAAGSQISSDQSITPYDEDTRYAKWQTTNFMLKNNRDFPSREEIENPDLNLIPDFKNYLILKCDPANTFSESNNSKWKKKRKTYETTEHHQYKQYQTKFSIKDIPTNSQTSLPNPSSTPISEKIMMPVKIPSGRNIYHTYHFKLQSDHSKSNNASPSESHAQKKQKK